MLQRLASLLVLFSALCGSAFASTEQWVEVSSPHFTIITDSNDKQGRHLLDQFERMRWMFSVLFPERKVDPPLPMVVIAAKNQKSFQSIEPAAYLAKDQLKIGGLFMKTQDKNYVLLRLDDEDPHPLAMIYHEYTHLQFSDSADWLPLWLNEGLAEFVQNTEVRDKDVLLGQTSVDDILYLRQNRLIPMATLFKVDASSPYYHEEEKGSVFYAESWALTHYLIVTDKQKGTHRVIDYMALVSQHEDPAVAGEKAFGDLKKLQTALEDYIRVGNYMQFILNSAAAPLDEASYKSKALTQTEADAYRADVLANVKRTDDARSLLDAVLKADPNNVQAHETMGFLAFRAGDTEAARKWYGEAVKLDSQSYLAHYYFAVMSMSGGAAPDFADVEKSLREAIRLNPRFAPAYDRLAGLLAMRHEDLEETRTLSLQAVQLDPGNLGFRINMAYVLTNMRQYSQAEDVLRTALKMAANPNEVEMVQARLKQIETMESFAAQPRAMVTASPVGEVEVQTAEKVVAIDVPPKHPTEPPNGPKHLAIGVIRGVQCSYPSVMEFHVETAKKPVSLYNNNYFKIEFTALGFTPKSDMHPCKDIEGMKARVQYAESSDKSVDGQVIAVELRK
jgi:tetratricopeptide (TPR) repeat protein